MRLGEILIRRGMATPQQVEAASAKQQAENSKRDLGQILLDDAIITEPVLLEALGQEFGCDVLTELEEGTTDSTLVSNLPVEWARSHTMLPIRWGDGLGVLTDDPSKIADLDDLSLLLGEDLALVLAPHNTITKAIERCYFQQTGGTEKLLSEMEEKPRSEVQVSRGSNDLLRNADQAPVSQLVNAILLEALKAGASDVHVEPFEKDLKVRQRVDGFLYDRPSPPKHLQAELVSRLKVMAHLDIAEKRLPQDGTARVRVGEREIDIRVSTVPVAEGERVVLRLLNRDAMLCPLTDLGMPERVQMAFRTTLAQPHGIIFVTGPTGSGKTTTLYAALQELDTAHLNVLTIEDPIEYQLASIGQIQIKPKIGLTFASGLRHILRQDPDVILVGETRDLETAEIAVRAALTGHLVFTTLHTNDATSAPIRMIDMGIEPYLLSSAVRACLAQRLLRQLCSDCKKQAAITPEDAKLLGPAIKRLPEKVYSAEGCPNCLGGYRGRTGIYEFMTVEPEVQEAIRMSVSAQQLRKTAQETGMHTLLDDGLEKAAAGLTSVSEVLRSVGHSAQTSE